MLDKIDLKKKLEKKEYDLLMEELTPKLALLQRECKAAGIPIMIVFEGWGASGKGTLINQLIGPLDPRGFKVFTIQKTSEEEAMRPFLWRFWTKTPAKGRIHIFDRSWYRKIVEEQFEETKKNKTKPDVIGEILNFEEELVTDGMVMIKFFLHISKKEQKNRFENLEGSKKTSWRVTDRDWLQNKEYDKYLEIFDNMIARTDTDFAPWTIIEASNKEYAISKIISSVVEQLSQALVENQKRLDKKDAEASRPKVVEETSKDTLTQEDQQKKEEIKKIEKSLKLDVLGKVDLSLALEKEEYRRRLKELQEKLAILHFEMYRYRIPVVLAFEGWDAGGKGGAIKRVTQNIDPRGYEVIPVAAPNDIEKAHHYLWRFWNAIPKAGHMTIFDRTWYGRVMVERVEGFCREDEWQRAYKEINQMEEHLTNSGCIVIKFWMNIDKEEQLKRFEERQNTPEKQWKITSEDWRNREKWDACCGDCDRRREGADHECQTSS
ncbi:MAG: phosphate--AMP phosphotransferase, partial [Clostridiales bacterium]|nr:phosphate--AMP phosphotransferase [Clostridiales bacterium]